MAIAWRRPACSPPSPNSSPPMARKPPPLSPKGSARASATVNSRSTGSGNSASRYRNSHSKNRAASVRAVQAEIALEHGVDVGRIERLFEKPERARQMGAARGASIERRGHHDDGHVRALALDPQQDVRAVEARHVVVEKHHAEAAVAQLVERGGAVRSLVTSRSKRLAARILRTM